MTDSIKIRDRIIGLERVKASELLPSSKNWRTHPESQKSALQGLLVEVGYAVPLVARRLPGGGLELIDGHLRAETTPDMEVPVVVLDVDEEEAEKLLATIDPLSQLAGQDDAALIQLLQNVNSDSAAVQKMLSDLIELPKEAEPPEEVEFDPELKFQIVIECSGEHEQGRLLERLTGEGLKCKALML